MGTGAAHADRLSRLPSDRQRAPWHRHSDGRVRTLVPDCRDRSRTGAGPAGEGQARAPFPGLQPDAVARQLGNVDVDPLWECRVILDGWTKLFNWNRIEILDEEHHVRIADVDCHRL